MIFISLNVVVLRFYPVLQVFLFLGHQLAFTLYLFKVRPFTDRNYIEMFNELMLLLTSSFLLVYTDFVKDPYTKYNFGWTLVGIMELTVMVNTILAAKQ